MRGRLERAPRQEERRRHDVELPSQLSRDRQRFRHVGRFHKSKPQRDFGEGRADLFQPHPLRRIDPRRRRGFNGQDDVLLVQHLVVLQTVHQGRRRTGRIAGQEYRGTGNPLRWPLFQHRHQIGQRKLQLARFFEQKPAAAPPGVHQQHDHGPQRQRHPAALEYLQEVRREERQIKKQEWRNQRRGREARPSPNSPDHNKTHHRRDHHGAGHGDTIGRCQRA